jgi:hypothetical protein
MIREESLADRRLQVQPPRSRIEALLRGDLWTAQGAFAIRRLFVAEGSQCAASITLCSFWSTVL